MNISRRITGDRLSKEAAVLTKNGIPRDLTSATVAFVMLDATGASHITETSSNVSAQPAVTFTVDIDRDEILSVAHGLVEGDEITLSSTTTLPSGLAASTRYFVCDISPHRFRVRLTPNDQFINIASAGTGTHSYRQMGYVEYAYQSTSTDTAGSYSAWFTVTASGIKDHHPNTAEGLTVEFVARG